MSRGTVLRAALGIAVVAGVAATANASGLLGASAGSPTATGTPAVEAPETVAVSRRTLTIEETLDGSLGYAGEREILNGLAGTLTRLPELGSTIVRGERLYEIDGKRRPVLFYGNRPAWRAFEPEMTSGADVQQLEENLEALGFGRSSMKVDAHWTSGTTQAVKRWQRAQGVTADGTIDLGEIVFAPGAIRVTESPVRLGMQVGPGQVVLTGTSDTQVASVDLDADRADLVRAGDAVTVDLPDGTTVDGTVTEVGAVAETATDQFGAPSSPTVEVTVALTLPDGASAWEQAPIVVRIVRETREDVLAVPVNALVALLEGGYAVERVAADGSSSLVAVELGLFQDGWVEVRTDDLAEGDAVAVPS